MARKKLKKFKRSKRRVFIRDYVQVHYQKNQQVHQAALVNLSLEGICCLFSQCPTIGDFLPLRLQKSAYTLEIRGQIRWVQQDEAHGPYKVGLEFSQMDTTQKIKLETLLKMAVPPETIQESLAQNDLHYNLDPVRDAVRVRYGKNYQYPGLLASIDQQELRFRGHFQSSLLSPDFLPPACVPIQIDFVSQGVPTPLQAEVQLKHVEKEANGFKFSGFFQVLQQVQLNIIRSFLVDHFLHCD
jgi:hypothetical protein